MSQQERASLVAEDVRTSAGTLLGHPKGLVALFFVEMWERFSYYGMRGLLVLYLTAALAAHQLSTGTYSNPLRITQATLAPDGHEVVGPESVIEFPLSVEVGTQGGEPRVIPIAGQSGPLKFVRLKKVPDPKKPGAFTWEPTGEALGSPVFLAKSGERPTGDPVRFRVVNDSDQTVKLTMKIQRPYSAEKQDAMVKSALEKAKDATPEEKAKIEKETREKDDPDYKVYFTANDSSGVVSTKIGPDKKRDASDDPYDISLDVNPIDSGRSWIKADANVLYGWYTGMAYLLPILGGLIADKLIGTHRSMIVGAILITIGHLALGASGFGAYSMDSTGMAIFVFGLAVITIGTGHFKPSVSVMVGQLYPLDDPRRESAFSFFYMGINLGAFLCNIVCGYLAQRYGWHYGFAAAAVGMILGLLTYLVVKPLYLQGIGETESPHRGKAWVFLPVGLVLAACVAMLFKAGVLRAFDEFVGQTWVFATLIVASLAAGVWFIASQEPGDRGPVATIFIYMLFNAVFWLSFEQAGSSLTTFTEELTDRRLGFIWDKVPTPQFQSVNPFLIIVLAPIFGVLWAALARRKKSFGQPYKIGLGLLFVGLGYVVMFFAAQRLNGGLAKVGMMYICGCYFLHTVGEIILSPTGLSYVAKTAPKRHVSSLMGIWFISSFVAGLAAGKVAALVDPIIEGKVRLPWRFGGQSDFFMFFVVSSIAAGVLVIVLAPLLVRFQRRRTD